MIHNMCKSNGWIVRRTAYPAGTHHPVIKCNTNDALPGNNRADLLVIKLALMWNQDPAVVVAGEYWTIERIQCLPESFIGEVGEIEKDPKFLHRAEQFDPIGCQSKFYGCTTSIATRAIMCGTNDSDTSLFPSR